MPVTRNMHICSHQSWNVTYGAFSIGAGRVEVYAASVRMTVKDMLMRLDNSGAAVSQNAEAAKPTRRFIMTRSQM
jgi:hypothetical protein